MAYTCPGVKKSAEGGKEIYSCMNIGIYNIVDND